MKRTLLTIALTLLGATAAFGQAADTPFQILYFANLNAGEPLINMGNSGASATVASPINGQICVNAYAISPDTGSLVSCCSCRVAANVLNSLRVKTDLVGAFNVPPSNSVLVKLMASAGSGGTCNPGTVNVGGNVLVTGMLAWGMNLHLLPGSSAGGGFGFGSTGASTYGIVETAFTPSTLSAAELSSLTTQCTNKGGGICSTCRVGGQ